MQLSPSPLALKTLFTESQSEEPSSTPPAHSTEFFTLVLGEKQREIRTTEYENENTQSISDLHLSNFHRSASPSFDKFTVKPDDVGAAERLSSSRSFQTHADASFASLGQERPHEEQEASGSSNVIDADGAPEGTFTLNSADRRTRGFPELQGADADVLKHFSAAVYRPSNSSTPVGDFSIGEADFRTQNPATAAPLALAKYVSDGDKGLQIGSSPKLESKRQELLYAENKTQIVSTNAEFRFSFDAPGEANTRLADAGPGQPAAPPASTEPRADIPTIALSKAMEFAPPFRISILTNAQDGALELRLDPPELGQVTLTFYEDDAGVRHAAVVAENPETLDLLRRHSDVLQRELARAGAADVQLSYAEKRDDDRRSHERSGLGKLRLDTLSAIISTEPPPASNIMISSRIDRFA